MPLSSPPPPRHRAADDARQFRILRDRHRSLTRAIDRRANTPKPFGTARMALSIFDGGNMPTSPGHFFLGHPVMYTGEACEGCPDGGSIDTTTTIPVLVLGTAAPVVGDQLTAYAVGGRWVAEKFSCCEQQCAPVTICCASSCNGGATFTPATGVTVTVSQGSTTIGTANTGSSGCFRLTIPASGRYTIVTSGNARYLPVNLTTMLACGETVDISLDPAPNFICLPCLSGEPISQNLLVSGGTGSVTLPATGLGNFALPASVPVLVPDNFANCNGDFLSDPCTVGSGITVQFGPGQGSECISIFESWTASTDCTHTSGEDVPISEFSLYGDNGTMGGGNVVPQWLSGPASDVNSVCMGWFAVNDGSTGTSGTEPFSVPLNITINFPPGALGTAPPIPTLTITEAM